MSADILELYEFEIARILWKDLGISWADFHNMDPQKVERILLALQIRRELNPNSGSGCPFS